MAGFNDIKINSGATALGREAPQISLQRTYRPKKPINFKKLGVLLVVLAFFAFGAKFAMSSIKANSEFTIVLEDGLNRMRIAEKIGTELDWSEREQKVFAGTHAQMQWDSFKNQIVPIFVARFNWGDSEKEAFITQSAKYLEPENDFLSSVFVPGEYVIKGDATMPEIADILISRIREEEGSNISDFIEQKLDQDAAANAGLIVQKELELLPDLVPLPAKDLRIDKRGDDVLLSFSTIYFNQGRGPLELIGDPKTKGIRSDITRNVLQKIYLVGGGYREKVAGTFLWHQEHLHYHFDDFVIYDLEAVDVQNPPDLSGVRTKSTFCIRDVSLVDKNYQIENRAEKAKYLICGKEIQGISVGWGDTYFYSYVDQNLNITDLPSGKYRLTFIANPEGRFDEISRDNNKSSILMDINMQNLTIKIVEEVPDNLPSVEHIYEEQVF